MTTPATVTTSKLLEQLADDALADEHSDYITMGEFVDKLSDRGFALAILLCAIPNFLPVNVPGISIGFSVIITILTLQLMFRMQRVWLPKRIKNKNFSEKTFARGLHKVLPIIKKMEKLIHPRATWMTGRVGRFITGAFILLQTFVLALPLAFIPFSNAIPAYAIAIMALGMLERDGYTMLFGIIGGTTALYFLWQVITTVVLKIWEYVLPYFV